MKDQDDTVPKLERASAKTLRQYEALKVIQEYANSLREFMKRRDTLGQAASSFDRQAISWHPLGATAAPTEFRDDRGGY